MVHRSLYNIVTVVVLLVSYTIPNWAQGYNISGETHCFEPDGDPYSVLQVFLRNRSDISLPFNKEKDRVIQVDSTGLYCFENVAPGSYVLIFSAFPFLRVFALEVTNKDEIQNVDFYEDGRDLPEQAQRDIELGIAGLYIIGGDPPMSYSTDSLFEERYGVGYRIWGDVIYSESAYYPEYNRIVFDYLTEKFGRYWRKHVRKDVEGYKRYSYKKHKRNSLDKSHR